MQIVLIGGASTRMRDRPRTLLVKEGNVWLWPGIPMTWKRGNATVPIDAATALYWLTKWHGPDANRQPIAMTLTRAADYLTKGNADAAQAVLDGVDFISVSPEGAALMQSVAARIGIEAPGLPIMKRNPLWHAQDIAVLAPMFDRFADTAEYLEKAEGSNSDPSKHPRLDAAPNHGWFADTKGNADQEHSDDTDADDLERSSDPPPEGVPADRLLPLEDEYDGLGPVEFAKAVIQFGDSLGRKTNLSTEEREDALARYAFLQDRLSFWLSYDYKPPQSQENLISAELVLYEGAVNSSLVPVGGKNGGFPRSMLYAAGVTAAYDNGSPAARLRQPQEPSPEYFLGKPRATTERTGELGGIVDNKDIGIFWKGGRNPKDNKKQGEPFERYIEEQNPDLVPLHENSIGFDLFNQKIKEAISAKTLNTLCITYIKYPGEIWRKLEKYIDTTDNYLPRYSTDLAPSDIVSKTIHLAIPEFTSPAQWKQILRAVIYAKSKGITMIVTRIR